MGPVNKTEAKVMPLAKITDKTSPEIVRAACYEAERQREKFRRNNTLQGAFESAMLSIEALNDSFDDPTKIYAFSDNGECAWAIQHYYLVTEAKERFEARLKWARAKVKAAGSHLLSTFDLILKNGPNREKSIEELIKRNRNRNRNRKK